MEENKFKEYMKNDIELTNKLVGEMKEYEKCIEETMEEYYDKCGIPEKYRNPNNIPEEIKIPTVIKNDLEKLKENKGEENNMKSLEALKDLFNEANRQKSAEYKFTTAELFTRYDVIKKDLEVLEILKTQIDIKRGLDTFSKKPIYITELKRFAFPLNEEKGQLVKEVLENE